MPAKIRQMRRIAEKLPKTITVKKMQELVGNRSKIVPGINDATVIVSDILDGGSVLIKVLNEYIAELKSKVEELEIKIH